MYGEQANKLVLDAKRIQTLPNLPPYAATHVRAVTKEVRDLDRDVSALLEPYSSSNDTTNTQSSSSTTQIKSSFNPAEDPATACSLLVNHLSMRRNKRCLLAYHRARVEKLEQLAWAGVDVLDTPQTSTPASRQPDTTASAGGSNNNNNSSLSAEEEQYAHQFSDLLAAYKGQWSDVDLTGSLEPPRDVFVDVRVLRDAGEIQTEYGSVVLTRNSQFFVRLGDVERLIQQGYLARLS
ncbi:hypothetical protein MBLNU230_g1040t1 [Neophaeotheca triangularis]